VKKSIIVAVLFAAAALVGCSGKTSSPVGLVDVARLTANWPQYGSAQSQLAADERAIQTGKGSMQQKRREVVGLEQKYAQLSNNLVTQIRNAAKKVAERKQLQLVLTHEFVGYGGTDITPDVEKILGITEKATPTP
jgi:Skp family chaperone for outer membrane proteins